MKRNYSLPSLKKATTALGVSLSLMTIISCSDEEISVDDASLNGTNESLITPSSGSTYYIRNRNSGRYMEIAGESNSNGANLRQSATSVSSSQTHRQWEIINVGEGAVRLRGVDSGKTLEVKDGSNANGSNIEQRSYDRSTHQQWEILATSGGFYRMRSVDSRKSIGVADGSRSNGANIELRSWNGAQKFQWEFIEVNGSGSSSAPTSTTSSTDSDSDSRTTTTSNTNSNSDTPGGAINANNRNWKLNGFVESPSSRAEYLDDVMEEINGNLATHSDDNYFYEENGFGYFKAYRGMESSSGSGNPRVELRELDGGEDADWNGDRGTHTMSFTVRVDELPNGWNRSRNRERDSGTVCFGQIHGPSGRNSDGVDVDDTIRVQFEGDRGQTSGDVSLKISGYITEEIGGGSESFDGFSLNTEYDFQIIFRNGRVSVTVDGDEIFGRNMDTSGNGSYFKVGNYIQSVQEGSFDGSFGLVGVKNVSVSHR